MSITKPKLEYTAFVQLNKESRNEEIFPFSGDVFAWYFKALDVRSAS